MSFSPTITEQSLRDYRQSQAFRGCFPDIADEMFARVIRYGEPVGAKIEVHERLPRCMHRLQEMISAPGHDREPLPSGTVVMARKLEKGSGRFTRAWHAPRGGLWLALAWADTLLPEYARLLPMAAGTACCQAIRSYGIDAALKWVNDIHIQNRKIGGILCETFTGGPAADRYHLIGIGINCNNRDFPTSLRSTAVSMQDILGTAVHLEEFGLILLGFLTWHFGLVHLHEEYSLAQGLDSDREDAEGSNPVIEAWKDMSDTIGRKVLYGYDVICKPLYRATAVDIDASGGLVLRLDNGELVTENSGEVQYLS